MNIADNILKYYLKNVYFLCGTACGGKTTISKALADKHGFLLIKDDLIYPISKQIADKENQPALTQEFSGWKEYFTRPYQEYHQWLADSGAEQLPMLLIELIKRAEKQKVVVDMHMPIKTAMKITERNRIAFLVTDPETVVSDYYHRPGHQEIYDCIMELDNPQRALQNVNKMLKYGTQLFLEELYQSDAFYIKRDVNSTVENTLAQVEKHFGLA